MTKLVIIDSNRPIEPIGGLRGPIKMRLGIDTIRRILSFGHKVYEVNPKNRKEKIELTPLNLYTKNFDNRIPPVPVAIEVKEEVKAPTQTSISLKTEEKPKNEIKPVEKEKEEKPVVLKNTMAFAEEKKEIKQMEKSKEEKSEKKESISSFGTTNSKLAVDIFESNSKSNNKNKK